MSDYFYCLSKLLADGYTRTRARTSQYRMVVALHLAKLANEENA